MYATEKSICTCRMNCTAAALTVGRSNVFSLRSPRSPRSPLFFKDGTPSSACDVRPAPETLGLGNSLGPITVGPRKRRHHPSLCLMCCFHHRVSTNCAMHASMGDAVRFVTLAVVFLVLMTGDARRDVPIRSRPLITYLSMPIFAQTIREWQHDAPSTSHMSRRSCHVLG